MTSLSNLCSQLNWTKLSKMPQVGSQQRLKSQFIGQFCSLFPFLVLSNLSKIEYYFEGLSNIIISLTLCFLIFSGVQLDGRRVESSPATPVQSSTCPPSAPNPVKVEPDALMCRISALNEVERGRHQKKIVHSSLCLGWCVCVCGGGG